MTGTEINLRYMSFGNAMVWNLSMSIRYPHFIKISHMVKEIWPASRFQDVHLSKVSTSDKRQLAIP